MQSPEFVLHGTSSEEGAKLINTEGFGTREGFPNVSANLLYAYKWATDKKDVKNRVRKGAVEGSIGAGRIILIKVPDGLKVGYRDITEINIDSETKEALGHVKNYVSGRNQLTFRQEKEEDRKRRQPLNIDPENICISVKPTEALGDTLKNLKKDIRSLSQLDRQRYVHELTYFFEVDETNKLSHEELQPIMEELVKSTIESEVVMMMRTL